ncbi:hypothetical protein [Allomuricauda sp. SCSIO 65647]|uniref:hypothetical protein n=1 Tax=Allomuricauda sp. SCSIO 65647 TaxID=2908843 RepID=UPI001F2A4424|nr:hypothetical protein [Muricauda sp. SCSIO 65647]UJH66637.1 hypothetical protein L0P89_11765 [Muricauda sp. SCSIO 65647]
MKTNKSLIILTLLVFIHHGVRAQKLGNEIVKSVAKIEDTYLFIQKDRAIVLDQLASKIFKYKKVNETVNVVFIDKENKEKSQLAAIWLKTGLLYYGLNGYSVISAGFETPNGPLPELALLEQYGFRVTDTSGDRRSSYDINYGSKNWSVQYKTIESIDLSEDDTLNVFVEQGIASEQGLTQTTIPLFSPELIAREMLYVASRINYLTEHQQ